MSRLQTKNRSVDRAAPARVGEDPAVLRAALEPKTRVCDTGDIKAMLETGNQVGKCADLNALFVGLCRASGVPARDVYGLRLAPSAFGCQELGANPADVLKVMRQEAPEWIKDPKHPLVAPVHAGLFGRREGNRVGWNTGHDVTLPGGAGKQTLPFRMDPNGENETGRFDEPAPDSLEYTVSTQEFSA